MNATTKKLGISALVLGLSGGVYAQAGGGAGGGTAAGGSMGAGGNGSTGAGSQAGGKGGDTSMGGSPDGTTGTGVKSGMGSDMNNNGMGQDQGTMKRRAPNDSNMNSNGTSPNGSGTKKAY